MVHTRRSCPDESLEALPMPSHSGVRTRSRSLSDAASPPRTRKNSKDGTKSPAAVDSTASTRSSRKGKSSSSASAKKKTPVKASDTAPLSPISRMAEDDAQITRSPKQTPVKEENAEGSDDDRVAPKTPPTVRKKSEALSQDTPVSESPEETPVKQKKEDTSDDDRTETKTPPTIRKKTETASQNIEMKTIRTSVGARKAEEDSDDENSGVDESKKAADANDSAKDADADGKEGTDANDDEKDQGDIANPHEAVNNEVETTAAATGKHDDETEHEHNRDTEPDGKVAEEKISKSDPKQLVQAMKKSRESISKPKRRKQPKNELTHIIPGYTAPLRLMTTWADVQRPSGVSGASGSALEDLRRKAVREDSASKRLNKSAHVMSERSTTGNLTASYRESHASFHTKRRKRLVPSTDAAGAGWFNMKATPMTEEVERDLSLIRNRTYLDPKRFYKSADKPKSGTKPVLQAGTVIEGPTEFYSSRLTKKQRKSNLVDEIMADPESSGWAQQKYKKMQQAKDAASQKWGKNIPNRKDYRKKKAL
eukprot:scaffold578_cov167-Amphora_coffeaeformis.AAC.28